MQESVLIATQKVWKILSINVLVPWSNQVCATTRKRLIDESEAFLYIAPSFLEALLIMQIKCIVRFTITRYSATIWCLPKGTFGYVNENDHIYMGGFILARRAASPVSIETPWSNLYRSTNIEYDEDLNSTRINYECHKIKVWRIKSNKCTVVKLDVPLLMNIWPYKCSVVN